MNNINDEDQTLENLEFKIMKTKYKQRGRKYVDYRGTRKRRKTQKAGRKKASKKTRQRKKG